MLTGLIGIISGVISGVVPDLVKELRDTRNHTRELEHLKLQHTLQMESLKVQGENKLREAESSIALEELRAFKESVAAAIETGNRKTGIVWIDAFNAVLRPATAALMMILFFWTAYVFTNAVIASFHAGTLGSADVLVATVWGGLLGEAILAVFGFLFGYRSSIKLSRR